ncbi:hypothetical protein LOZ58_001960, partial [Ophidiomyces ophidiicola]
TRKTKLLFTITIPDERHIMHDEDGQDDDGRAKLTSDEDDLFGTFCCQANSGRKSNLIYTSAAKITRQVSDEESSPDDVINRASLYIT